MPRAATGSQRVSEFEALRPHLMAVAYRLTGTVADAEDIVQEAWLRWDSACAAIVDLRAWLTTVVSRLALDRLRSAAHRRETYVGHWLPEPVVTGFDGTDPLSAVVAREDARFAAMVVLERLSPDQRVAFVLHDGFAVPFAEVAEVLGTNEPAARQLASRARRAVTAQPPPKPDPSHNEVVGRLMAAMASGDVGAVVALLHPDVTFTGDSNGKAPTANRPQNCEMPAIEGHNRPRAVSISQHHVGGVRNADALITVLLDDGDSSLELGHAEIGQFPCTAGQFTQHSDFGIHADARADQIVQFRDDIGRDDEQLLGAIDDAGYRLMVRLFPIEIGKQRAGVDDHRSPKPSKSSSTRRAIGSEPE